MNSLKDFRVKTNLKQYEAANKLGISKDYLYMLEAGKRTPSTKLISAMAILYNIPAQDIFLTISRTYCSTNENEK